VEVPLDLPKVFGRARPPVSGTVNGAPLRSTIAKYGDDYLLVINRQVREAARAAAGDTVEIELELDTKPRIVRLPKDFAAALDKDARAEFNRMSHSHRKDYVDWIKEAKREETRRRRIAKAVEMIREGKPQR
jgi:uncharacterized protein YdeI (YjbR/CyaY-like superfamily)